MVYFAICSFAAVASAFMIPQTHRRLHRFGRYLARDAERPFYFAEELDQQSAEEKDKSPIVLPQRATKLPWKFQGHDIYAQVSLPERSSPTKLPAVLLVHGFGCSTYYWRQTIAALTNAGYTVYAIDLLGQGMSAKPYENVTYSINLWAKQLDEFCRENLQPDERVVFIGNSIGSIVSLIAATGDFANETNGCYIKEHIAGIGMFNCGIGMNVRSLTRDPKWSPTQRYLLNAIFDVLESAVFGNVNFLRWILDKVVTRELLRTTLIELYPTAENPEEIVDDELVESIYLPAKEPGSPEVLSQILVNDAGEYKDVGWIYLMRIISYSCLNIS